MIISDIWKNFGYNTIIYLAALTGIDPTLYEAAMVDGAGKIKQTIHVTMPGIAPFIALMTIMSIGSVLNAGFDQIFNLYSPAVYATGDIIDTLVYRLGLINQQYSLSGGRWSFEIRSVLYPCAYRLQAGGQICRIQSVVGGETHMNRKKTSMGRKVFLAVDVIVILLLCMICMVPLLNLLAYSFSASQPIIENKVFLWPKEFTLKAYQYVLESKEFWSSVSVSVKRDFTGWFH